MKKSLLLFLLLPFFVHGQFLIGAAANNKGGAVKHYTPIPAAPAFSDTHTLIQATTGNSIQSGDTGGKTDFLIGSDYPLFQLNGLSGSYRIKSLDSTDPSTWAVLGEAGQAAAINNAVSVPNVEYYNVKLMDANNLVKMTPANPVKTQVYQNIIAVNAAFASYLINDSNSGENYGDASCTFCRSIDPGGENVYWGNTGNDITTFTGTTTVTHFYGTNSGREGLQFNGHADLRVEYVTCINGGLDTGAGIGQNNCIQVQNCIGYVKKAIFWNFPAPMMVAADQFVFEDCFFFWTNATRQIYLQNMTANGYDEYKTVGGTLTFRRCTFYNPDYTEDELFRLQEPDRNYVFEDCVFPTSTEGVLYNDERGTTSYTITVTGDTYTDTPPLPTFIDPPESAYVGFEKVISSQYYWDRQMGYRSQH